MKEEARRDNKVDVTKKVEGLRLAATRTSLSMERDLSGRGIKKFTFMSSTPDNQHTPTASGSGSNDLTDILRNARFSMDQAPTQSESVTASDVLGGAFDPTKLHPMAGLSDQLDYLNLEDDKTNELPGATTALPSRGWSDDLCYGTGTTYLSGEYQ